MADDTAQGNAEHGSPGHGAAGYLAVNRANWDERVPAHVASPGYAMAQFRADPAFLSEVVQYDLPLLGSVAGLRGVHLQCHIGTDTVSWPGWARP